MGFSVAIFVWFSLLSQRVAITIGQFQFSIGMIFFFVCLIIWLYFGSMGINKKRLKYFLFSISGIIISSLVTSYYSNSFSITSLILLIGIYLPTVFIISSKLQLMALKHFRTAMLIFAVIGIIQLFTQLAGIPFRDWMDFFSPRNIIQGYAYRNPVVMFGISMYKPNGVFFSEPSIFSQLISLAILIEVYLFRKYWRLFILLAGLLSTFSGTGLILLAIGLMPLVSSMNFRKNLALIFILLIVFSIFLYSGLLSYTINRVNEFQNPDSSGSVRFINPVKSYREFFLSEATSLNFWIGVGPGSSEDFAWERTTYPNAIMKLLVEYGMFGLLFFMYLTYIFFANQPFWLSLSIFCLFTLLSGALLTPQHLIIIYILLFLYGGSKLNHHQIASSNRFQST